MLNFLFIFLVYASPVRSVFSLISSWSLVTLPSVPVADLRSIVFVFFLYSFLIAGKMWHIPPWDVCFATFPDIYLNLSTAQTLQHQSVMWHVVDSQNSWRHDMIGGKESSVLVKRSMATSALYIYIKKR